MKTVIYQISDGVVVNVGTGAATGNPPAGLAYDIVADDLRVGPGHVWQADGVYIDPAPPYQPTATEIAAEAAAVKQRLLDTIVVTTSNGNTFDGNETARNNMVSAILVSDVAGQTETPWKLADNTVVVVGLQELKEALMLSIREVGRIVGAT